MMGTTESGKQQQQPGHPSQLDLQGLNQAGQKNQMQMMAKAPRLNMLIKNRQEKPSLVSQVNERTKNIQLHIYQDPQTATNMVRAMSLEMSLPEVDQKGRDFAEEDIVYKDFSLSMSMPTQRARSESSDEELAKEEERQFFLRSGSMSMFSSLAEFRDEELYQMSDVVSSMSMETSRTTVVSLKRIEFVPEGSCKDYFFQHFLNFPPRHRMKLLNHRTKFFNH